MEPMQKTMPTIRDFVRQRKGGRDSPGPREGKEQKSPEARVQPKLFGGILE